MLWEQPTGDVVDPNLGRVIEGRYRIASKLGEGGMGSVYSGEHILTKRRVAVKLLHAKFGSDPVFVKRFHNEAQAATSIGHPNIVDVLDLGRLEDGTSFMVLEMLDGEDFEGLIEREGPLTIGAAVEVMLQVCDALKAAHARGIVHRDLKPENVFLVKRPDNPRFVKILDFGIAKIDNPGDHRLTQTGAALGTPFYMAPEQLGGAADVDQRADLYSMGVILFHALTAAFPFHAESFAMLVVQITHHPPPPLRSLRTDVPPELEQIIDRLLAKNPVDRPESAEALRNALLPFRELRGAPAMRTAPGMPRTMVHEGAAHTPVIGAMPTPPPMMMAPPVYVPEVQQPPRPAYTQPESEPRRPQVTPQPTPHTTTRSTGVGRDSMVAALPPSKLPMLVALGSLVVALVVVVAFVAISLRTPPPAPVAAPQPRAPAPAPALERVHVSIETEPSDAELFLDGEPIGNPFDGELDRGTRLRVEARKSGYQTVTRELNLRFPQHVRLALVANAPPPPPPSEPVAVRPQTRPEPVAVAPTPQVRPAPPPPTIAPAPPPVAAPPAGLKRIRF